MKRIIALLLILSLFLASCGGQQFPEANDAEDKEQPEESVTVAETEIPDEEKGDSTDYTYEPDFKRLDDQELLSYVEDNIYLELYNQLDSEKYYIENVSAKYVSKEYLEELSYNSQSNIFFGYALEDIVAVYGDSKYVFTLGDDGTTVVRPMAGYDDTYEKVIKNVAIGTGVILVCVTVAAVTGGLGAPAVSMIFATSAKTATTMALSSGLIGGVAEAVVTGFETGDMSGAIKAGAVAGSEGFKWGAISGALVGGATGTAKYVQAMKMLEGVELNLTLQQAAAIQMESGYPAQVIAQFHSMEEYQVFKEAGLRAAMVNGEIALVRNDIDLNIVDEYGRSNLTRMKQGLSPLVEANNYNLKYELHHIGQEADATLTVLTSLEHDNPVLHGFKMVSEIDRPGFDTVRIRFWKTVAKMIEQGLI